MSKITLEPSYLQAKLIQLSQHLLIPHMFQSPDNINQRLLSLWLLIGLSPGYPCLPCTGKTRTEHNTLAVFNKSWTQRKDHLSLLAGLLLMQPTRLLASFDTGLNSQLSVYQDPRSFSGELLPRWWALSRYWCLRLYSTFPFVEVQEVPLCLLRSLWLAA